MKVHYAEYLKSGMKPEHYPKDGRPEIAFVGRSNVGKSSLLNTLLGRKGLAKTSGTPGKTQTVNFFNVNHAWYAVDLPGYGFAKVPLKLKEQWNKVMMDYLREREPLRLVVALLDARHKPGEHDHYMLELLEEAEKPTLIVATKWDKLKQSEQKKQLAMLHQELGLDEEAVILPFSSITGRGAKELWRIIDDVLAGPVPGKAVLPEDADFFSEEE